MRSTRKLLSQRDVGKKVREAKGKAVMADDGVQPCKQEVTSSRWSLRFPGSRNIFEHPLRAQARLST